MVGTFIVMGIFASFMMAGLWLGDSDEPDEPDTAPPPLPPGPLPGPDPEPEPDPDPEVPGNNLFLVEDGDTLTGTSGDDVFFTDEGDADGTLEGVRIDLEGVRIDAGGGNDLLDLYDGDIDGGTFDEGPVLFDTEITLGDGNDTAILRAELGSISGGPGDDTITLIRALGMTVTGDDGDDVITLRQVDPGDFIVLSGGNGNDVIDAAATSNGIVRGDAGDDILRVAGYDQGGAGFVIEAQGGAGDDTLIYQGAVPLVDGNPVDEAIFGLDPLTMLGGEGADRFEIRIGQTSPAEYFLTPEIFGFDATTEDGNVHDLVTVGDFQPGVDLIVVEASHLPASEGETTLTLTEDTAAGTTAIDVLFEPLTGPSYTARITVNALGLTEDDVVFVLAETTTTGMTPISVAA